MQITFKKPVRRWCGKSQLAAVGGVYRLDGGTEETCITGAEERCCWWKLAAQWACVGGVGAMEEMQLLWGVTPGRENNCILPFLLLFVFLHVSPMVWFHSEASFQESLMYANYRSRVLCALNWIRESEKWISGKIDPL